MQARISVIVLAAFLAHTVSAQTPSEDIARGNMPKQIDVKEMDSNHDGMITEQEFIA